ncbi:MAG: DUF4416 family protein [Chitinispirillia bacterium]|nr:DUF4416 family protein [Chitinispirillia bacterium]MCL2268043.1 DUF4416 family protein [Chitinispirillia bacterium]
MADVRQAAPVKYFAAVLYKGRDDFARALQCLTERWGAIDISGTEREFDVTGYYGPEMGAPLFRTLVSFEKLYDPMLIVDMKLECNEIERQLSVDSKRTVNLDAGYLDHNKVVLASAKEAGQKVYLGKGIYADLAGRYKEGKYRPFEWSFPDFRDGRYDKDLLDMRAAYMAQKRQYC